MGNRYIYGVELQHKGLNKYRVIRGTDKYVVEQKARAQRAVWDKMWQKKLAAEEKRLERERKANGKEQKKTLAILKTDEAQTEIKLLENTLKQTLSIDDTIEWESLKDHKSYETPKPSKPKLKKIPIEPKREDEKYNPKLSILDKIFSSRRERKLKENDAIFDSDYKDWSKKKRDIELYNKKLLDSYDAKVTEWEKDKDLFYQKQKETNKRIDEKMQQYFDSNPEAIFEYCDMVLTNSEYPDYFPKEFDLDYNPENKILIVDYSLPSIDSVPTLKEVKYIQTRDEFKETFLSDAALRKMYDDLLYQIVLRSIHELFEADVIGALDSIVFNGWVNSIDKATGKEVNACILTIQVGQKEFNEINLELVDPKKCFKNLKGIGSTKLHSLTPVAPIITIDKEDRRFVSSYNVSDELDDSYNLAAMDWEDFEHLIRELFEKEFSTHGGEVKVTQASRDGGVDAIAFDPDFIRGGKIVIQAKRYTNVVGVSAVRDLYGTLINEGATKGILITTADYGPDAYDFARGKPLTLLNGNNLLHLLEKHGTKAKIDLKEAKKILAEKENNN